MNSKEIVDNVLQRVETNDINVPNVDERFLKLDKLYLLKVIDVLVNDKLIGEQDV